MSFGQTYKFKLKYLGGTSLQKNMLFTICVEEPHITSLANLLLLKRSYIQISHVNKSPEWRIWLTFRNKYLRRQRKINGSLKCYLCPKDNLIANFNSPFAYGRQATIDHKKPLSKGGKKYDERNLAVCCNECNNSKADSELT